MLQRVLRVVLGAAIVALPIVASAQTGGAVVAGTVRDSSGGAVPGAKAKI